VAEDARLAGLAWERLPNPRPALTLEILSPSGQQDIFYLGPHAPRLTQAEIDLLHGIWLELSQEVAPQELHHHDVVHMSLEDVRDRLGGSERGVIVARLREHLQQIKARRAS
jgi:hypothetical protein